MDGGVSTCGYIYGKVSIKPFQRHPLGHQNCRRPVNVYMMVVVEKLSTYIYLYMALNSSLGIVVSRATFYHICVRYDTVQHL